MKVLITGGAGYIGSHCNRYFNEQGIETVVVDDLSDELLYNICILLRQSFSHLGARIL